MNIGDNLFQIMRLTQTTGVKSNVVPNTVPEKEPTSPSSNSPKSFFAQEAATTDFSPEALAKSQESKSNPDEEHLSDAEKEEVQKLKERDTEVRQHEQAHLAAAGQYAKGGAQYDFQTGPDEKQYAVGGEVNIDTSPISGDPSATIAKAQVIKSAAMAPAEPSAQDNRVAADAAKMEAKAKADLAKENQEKTQGTTDGDINKSPSEETPLASNPEQNAELNTDPNMDNKKTTAQRNAQQNAANQYSQSYQAFSPGHTNFSRPAFSMSA